MSDLKQGDIVEMISTSPKMTVTKVGRHSGSTDTTVYVNCAWYCEASKEVKKVELPAAALRICSKTQDDFVNELAAA